MEGLSFYSDLHFVGANSRVHQSDYQKLEKYEFTELESVQVCRGILFYKSTWFSSGIQKATQFFWILNSNQYQVEIECQQTWWRPWTHGVSIGMTPMILQFIQIKDKKGSFSSTMKLPHAYSWNVEPHFSASAACQLWIRSHRHTQIHQLVVQFSVDQGCCQPNLWMRNSRSYATKKIYLVWFDDPLCQSSSKACLSRSCTAGIEWETLSYKELLKRQTIWAKPFAKGITTKLRQPQH